MPKFGRTEEMPSNSFFFFLSFLLLFLQISNLCSCCSSFYHLGNFNSAWRPGSPEILGMFTGNSKGRKKGRTLLSNIVTAKKGWDQTVKKFTKCLTEKWRSFHSRLYHSALHCTQHSSKRPCPYDSTYF